MKQLVYVVLILLFLSSCKEKEGYVIEGKMTGLEDPALFFVTTLPENQGIKVDTILCKKNGNFSFKGTSESPEPVTIYMEDGKIWFTVWVENKEKIVISGDVQYPELIMAKGGRINNLLAEFKSKNKALLKEKRDLSDNQSSNMEISDSVAVSGNQSVYKSKISNIDHQLREKAEEFIVDHPTSIASLVLIQDYLMDVAHPELIQKYLSKITGEATQNPLYQKLVQVNKQIQQTVVGAKAPDFSVLDIHNDTIRLSSYKGSYFLLTFSASWCEMCDKDNEELSDLRKKINKEKLGMLTISLDEDSAAWTNIVKEKQLPWNQVVDTHGWGSEMVALYNITEIPTNLLVDKEGVIVGRHLSTDSIIGIIQQNK